MQRLVPRLAVTALVLLPFVACDSTDMAGVETPTPGAAVPTAADSSRLIYVVPVEGVNGPGRLVLADAIAAQLRDADKPAVLAEAVNERGPTVTGTIEKVEEHDSVVWVTAEWALRAPYGTTVAEYRHQIVVDAGLWRRGSAEAINLLAADAGPAVSAMISDYISPVAPAPASTQSEPESQPESEPQPRAAPAVAGRAPPPGADVAEAPPTRFHPPSPPGRPRPPAEGAPKETRMTPLVAPPAPRPETKPTAKSAFDAGKPRVLTTAARTPQPAPAPAAKKTALEPEGKSRPRATKTPKEKPRATPKEVAKKRAEKVLMPVPEDEAKAKKKETPRQTALKKAEKVLMPVPEDKPSRLVPDPQPVSWGRPSFLIKPVRGAPGDGNASLTEAMKDALRKRDLTVTEDPRQAGFVIEGKVELSAPVDGRQHAKIVWAVNTINGEEVGKAVQENAVKAGSLNGPWGRVAVIVSNAAVVGIQELFGIEEKQSSRAVPPPDFSKYPSLPQLPGRAPPPPK